MWLFFNLSIGYCDLLSLQERLALELDGSMILKARTWVVRGQV